MFTSWLFKTNKIKNLCFFTMAEIQYGAAKGCAIEVIPQVFCKYISKIHKLSAFGVIRV